MPCISNVQFETLDHNFLCEPLDTFFVRSLTFFLLVYFFFNLFYLVFNLRVEISKDSITIPIHIVFRIQLQQRKP